MERIGVFESFGEVGTQEYLMKRFGLTAGDIYTKAKKAIARRKSA
jgi:transketolase